MSFAGALRDLSHTLASYVALPPVFRTTHALKDGKTARQLLGEQLALLDTQMREVVANVASANAQALLANQWQVPGDALSAAGFSGALSLRPRAWPPPA